MFLPTEQVVTGLNYLWIRVRGSFQAGRVVSDGHAKVLKTDPCFIWKLLFWKGTDFKGIKAVK